MGNVSHKRRPVADYSFGLRGPMRMLQPREHAAYEDRLGYSRALGDAEKSDTLLNVVRLRYADTPIVLQATQVISGYQLQRNVTGGFEAFPAANPSTFLSGSVSAQLQQSPTFTFQPLSGAQFAQSFIRPLARPTFCRSP
jgi:hypothetical protein